MDKNLSGPVTVTRTRIGAVPFRLLDSRLRDDPHPERAAFARGHAQFVLDNGEETHRVQLAIKAPCWQTFSAALVCARRQGLQRRKQRRGTCRLRLLIPQRTADAVGCLLPLPRSRSQKPDCARSPPFTR